MKTRWLLAPVMCASYALLAMAPAGCAESDEGGGSNRFTDYTRTLAPQTTFTDDDIRHFLIRTQFGVTQREFDKIKASSIASYVSGMVVLPQNANSDVGADAQIVDKRIPQHHEMVRWWLYHMVYNNNPFQEVVAMFWHDHFATSQDVLGNDARRWFFDHINRWRRAGCSNLRTLLYDMTTDSAMLVWLDGYLSRVGAPNENFAREFWELFTLGANNGYTEDDIKEASKAFTGWKVNFIAADVNIPGSVDQSHMVFDPARHDTTNKTIFGQTLTGRTGQNSYREYYDMVDLTLAQRATECSEFICRKILEWFCYPNPPLSIVQQLATTLRVNDWSLAAVFSDLFTSAEFFSTAAKRSIVKNPVEHALGFIRTTKLEISLDSLRTNLSNAAMYPTAPPTVNGWPSGGLWLGAQGMVERANLLRESVVQRTFQAGNNVGITDSMPPSASRTDGEVVDHYVSLLDLQLDAGERQQYIDYLNSDYVDVMGTLTVVADPFDGNNTTQQEKKVRGLLYILGQHPSYAVR